MKNEHVRYNTYYTGNVYYRIIKIASAIKMSLLLQLIMETKSQLSLIRYMTRYIHLLITYIAVSAITKICLFKYIENFTTKNRKFSDKNSDIFHISAQNIDCGYSLEPPRRGGSNEYPQSMFLSRNKENNAYRCKPQFYYIKVGFKGVKII